MYQIIYFSPTGNAKYLAEKLSGSLGKNHCEISAMEFCDIDKLRQKDHLILIFPIHAFNAPRNVKKFVKNIPEGLYKGVSLIAVGSSTVWMNDAVTHSPRKSLEAKNYTIYTDTVIAMPLTIIMAFGKELSEKTITDADEAINKVANQISKRQISEKNVPLKSKIINEMGKGESFAARLFGLELYANDNCISCSKCWKNCPVQNISKGKNDKPRFSFSCLMCMRCIYSCEQKAISPRFSKFVPISKGYKIEKLLRENKN